MCFHSEIITKVLVFLLKNIVDVIVGNISDFAVPTLELHSIAPCQRGYKPLQKCAEVNLHLHFSSWSTLCKLKLHPVLSSNFFDSFLPLIIKISDIPILRYFSSSFIFVTLSAMPRNVLKTISLARWIHVWSVVNTLSLHSMVIRGVMKKLKYGVTVSDKINIVPKLKNFEKYTMIYRCLPQSEYHTRDSRRIIE